MAMGVLTRPTVSLSYDVKEERTEGTEQGLCRRTAKPCTILAYVISQRLTGIFGATRVSRISGCRYGRNTIFVCVLSAPPL
jgi:hypothetical protein